MNQGFEHLAVLIDQAPTDAGVYLMKGEEGKVIYVGKAKNLRSRTKSYIGQQAKSSLKTSYLMSHVRDIEFIVAGTEVEALILENNLIKKHKPKYNIRLRDDKTYPYIRLDFSHDYPRPYVARRPEKRADQKVFGPFIQSAIVYRSLSIAAKVFKLRDCRDHEFSNRTRPCLSYQIGQCTAPCVQYVSKEEYASQVSDFIDFLEGRSEGLENRWTAAMEVASEAMEYEKAASYRDRLQTLSQLSDQGQRMENMVDRIAKDIWAFWPLLSEENVLDLEHVDILVLQFRDGKLLGREHYTMDCRDKVILGDFVSSVVLQYYSKKECPSEVILPDIGDGWKAEDLEQVLSHEDCSVSVKRADATESSVKLYQLAIENAQLLAKEQSIRREARQDALKSLAYFLKLPRPPRRLECLDVSNFQGQANVASCVVFVDGRPSLNDYRHYNIKTVIGQNDFASMKEIIIRRYTKPDVILPDLLVLDGGKGQLNAVYEVFKELGLNFPLVALAKARTESNFSSATVEVSQERVFFPGQKNSKVIKNPEVLRLMTHLRDEAHRFAINFHRKKRSEDMFD